jgi:hypothetical protein
LEDVVACCAEARTELSAAIERSARHMDPVLLASLARLSQCVANMEALARDARQGKYQERP